MWPVCSPTYPRCHPVLHATTFHLEVAGARLAAHYFHMYITEAWGGLFDASSFGGWGAAGGSSEAGGGAEGSGAAEGAPFHFYVAAPARTDPSVVERVSDDAVMALVPVPPIDERLSAEAQAEACAAAVARARCVTPPSAALALPAL